MTSTASTSNCLLGFHVNKSIACKLLITFNLCYYESFQIINDLEGNGRTGELASSCGFFNIIYIVVDRTYRGNNR